MHARATPNPLAPMLLNTMYDGPSIMLLAQHLDIHSLWVLSRTNQEFRARLMVMGESRKLWIDVAVRVAGYPGNGFEPDKLRALLGSVSQELEPFYTQLRALICPWTSVPEWLPLRILFRTVHPHPRYMLLDETATRLTFQVSDQRELNQASSPAVPSVEFARGVNLFEPRVQFSPEELHPAASVVNLRPRHFFVPDFSVGRNLSHRYYFVHGGVFAVIECHNHHRSVTVSDGFNGVYFFACSDGRLLRHMSLEGMTCIKTSFIQSRPTKLWLMMQQRVALFRLKMEPHHDVRPPNLASPTERMDPALWMAGIGDTQGATRYLLALFNRQNIRDVIDVRSNANRRSLLHYAAAEGQTWTCQALLEAGASLVLEDCSHMTPIALAVSKLHYDTAMLLIQRRGEMEVEEFSKVWWEVCHLNPSQLSQDEDNVLDQCRRIIPGLVRALLFTSIPTATNFILPVHLQRAMESMFILSSPEATTLVLRSGGQQFLEMCQKHKDIYNRIFGNIYPTHTHEMESFETVKTLFTEFGLDVNRNMSMGTRPQPPLVHAVMKGNLSLIRFMIEELGADLRVKRRPSGEDLRILIITRSVGTMNGLWRDEVHQMRVYIEDLFQRHGIVSPYWNPPVVTHVAIGVTPAAG